MNFYIVLVVVNLLFLNLVVWNSNNYFIFFYGFSVFGILEGLGGWFWFRIFFDIVVKMVVI